MKRLCRYLENKRVLWELPFNIVTIIYFFVWYLKYFTNWVTQHLAYKRERERESINIEYTQYPILKKNYKAEYALVIITCWWPVIPPPHTHTQTHTHAQSIDMYYLTSLITLKIMHISDFLYTRNIYTQSA